MQTLVVIQARLASTRLPGKALLPLAGMPMLGFLLERLRGLSGRFCLATTWRPEDLALASLARDLGVEAVQGEEDDVLARFLRCLDRFPAQAVARVTADNPLTCPELVEAALRLVLDGAEHAGLPQDCPVGLGADAFSAQALRRMALQARAPDEREHINLHALRHPSAYQILRPTLPPTARRPDIRLTVDTPEDLDRVRRLVEHCCADSLPLRPQEVVAAHDQCFPS